MDSEAKKEKSEGEKKEDPIQITIRQQNGQIMDFRIYKTQPLKRAIELFCLKQVSTTTVVPLV